MGYVEPPVSYLPIEEPLRCKLCDRKVLGGQLIAGRWITVSVRFA
jgi:hypothetical protein